MDRKTKKYSIIALILSLLPLATLIPVFMNIPLYASVQTIWAIVNIISILTALALSVFCVKSKDTRNIINITSTVISGGWSLNVVGIAAIALVSNILG